MKKLVLIDSNALVHRAFHALPPLNSPTGVPTNAVYGFVSVLLKMMNDLKPDAIAATFDLAGPTFRHAQYEPYKAHRAKAPDELYAQIPLVKKMLTAFGIPIYTATGFEADDVIGSIAEKTKALPGLQTIIVTGDMDTLQLVTDEKVVVFTLRKGMTDTVTYDEDAVVHRYGLTPAQVVDFKGLKGDPSDNIPGVPGIGEKTATALIQKFGTVEKIYEAVAKGKIVKPLTEKLLEKLTEYKEQALLSKQLATIVRTVPVEFSLEQTDWRAHLDADSLQNLCKEFGFFSLTKRITATLGASVPPPEPKKTKSTIAASANALPDGDRAALVVASQENGASSLFITTDGTHLTALTDLSPASLAQALGRYKTIIAHDAKPLIKALDDMDAIGNTKFFDTHIAAWLCNPELRDHSLERVSYEFLSETPSTDPSQWPLILWRLEPLLHDRMKSLGVLNIFTDMEMPLVPVLARMERLGIHVDEKTISGLLKTITKEVQRLEREIHKLAGTEFNINSPSQLGDILFNHLAIRGRVRHTGKGAPSTAAPELEKLREEHEIIGKVLEYRELNKLKNTYIEPFPSLIAPDGRIHTTYHQSGTATGRLSSSDPNLQNIPTRTELGQQFRAAFIADPGFSLVSLDYSQLELRIVAHIAKDETMIEAFKQGQDIHTRTASEIFSVVPEQVTKDMRRQAKVLNFGIIYGMGILGFARAAGVNRETAKRFIDEYFKRFSGVARYMERTKEEAFTNGFVSTLFGRRRPLPDITSTVPQLAAQAERMAINHPIQGTGADLVKLAMLSLDRTIREKKWEHSVRMLLQVHDELVLEVATDQAEKIARECARLMENVHHLDVPLVVDAKIGTDWSDMKPL